MVDPQATTVASLDARRARHEADAKALLGTALDALSHAGADAYLDVFESSQTLRRGLPEVRVMVCVAVGDPVSEDTGIRVGTFAPDAAMKVEDAQARAMTLGAVKAVAPELWEQINMGHNVAELIATLGSKAERGETKAAGVLEELRRAVGGMRRAERRESAADPAA